MLTSVIACSAVNGAVAPGLESGSGSLTYPFGTMKSSPSLIRDEALQKLSEFIDELDRGWERDGLEWSHMD